jgi:hypothetical protein
MIRSLHPTLKACKCGYIGSRSMFYKHMDAEVTNYTSAQQFFINHGEAVLNIDDPRVATTPQPPTRKELIDSL